ncbi:hypothetical protein DV515_00001252, partial [Chloebia gouldiae]
VNSRKQTMDTQLFSPLLGAVPSSPTPPEPSQQCRDWPGCAEDFGSQTAFQECPKQRNSPARLFPPVWTPDLGSNGEFPGLPAQHCAQNQDFPNLLGSSCRQEPLQEPPEVEMLHRGLGDLQLLESWLSPCAHPSNAPRNPENSPLQGTAPQEGFSFPNGGWDQHLCTYDHGRLNGGYEKCGSDFRPFSPQSRKKESLSVEKEFWRRGKAVKKYAQGQTQYSPDLSNQSADNSWDKVPQDSHMFSKRYENFPAAHKLQSPVHPSLHLFNPPPKENTFSGGAGRKPQESHVENGHCGFALGDAFNNNNECKVNMASKGSSPQAAESVQNGNYSSYQGCAWLDGNSLAAASEIPCGKQMATSPQSSSGVSSMSGGSPTHQPFTQPSYYSQLLPTLPARKDGRLQTSNEVSSHLGVPRFISESQKQMRRSQEGAGLKKEGWWHKLPVYFSPDWLVQQKAAGEDPAEKYQRFPKRQSQEKSGSKDGRRGRRNWSPHLGSRAPSRQPFDVFPAKHEQNGGGSSDFISPPRPSFPFLPDFQQNPSFPPFHHQLFAAANPFNFPPPPFPRPDLVDRFRCDDFNPLGPFVRDLFPGEIPAPCFAFPAPFNKCRAPRSRSGPASELSLRLEECYEQWRALEKERKKAEADLARHFPGQHISSPVAWLHVSSPPCVDRLMAEQRRERARVLALMGRMERLCGAPLHRNISRALELHLEAIEVTQARRNDAMGNAANPQSHGGPRYNNEKGNAATSCSPQSFFGGLILSVFFLKM